MTAVTVAIARHRGLEQLERAHLEFQAEQQRQWAAREDERRKREADQARETAAHAAEEARIESRYNRVINCVECEGEGKVYLAEHPEWYWRLITLSRWSRGAPEALIEYSCLVTCPYCRGAGIAFAAIETVRDISCDQCAGKGGHYRQENQKADIGVRVVNQFIPCHLCKGTGRFSGQRAHYRTVVPNGEVALMPRYAYPVGRGYRRTVVIDDSNRALFAKNRPRTPADY